MGKKMRILHVLYSHVYGGAENIVCQIIHMFQDNPDVEMFYTSPDGSVRPSLEERGIRYYPLKAFTVSEIRRVIREVQPTVLHTHDMRACFMTARACGNLPFISHIHNNNFDSRKITPKAVLYLLAAQKAKRIFWVSDASYNGYRFHEALKDKSMILRNVVDPKDIRAKAERAEAGQKYDILFLGRMDYPKNPTRLVEVMAAVSKAEPGVQCGIAGIGDLEADVKAKIEELGCGDSVHQLGFLSNPYGMLRDAKLMLMTSRWEGLPMCALEAMTLGTPIVSTPVDGLLDVVEPGKTGYLAAENEALVQSCLTILRDAALREKMRACCTAKAEELLNVEQYKQTLLDTYAHCMGERK